MFEYNDEEKRYVAMHHPFTAPRNEDLAMLATDPGKVYAKAYDMVLNGTEIGGGPSVSIVVMSKTKFQGYRSYRRAGKREIRLYDGCF